jgi:hypothetical protein
VNIKTKTNYGTQMGLVTGGTLHINHGAQQWNRQGAPSQDEGSAWGGGYV